MRTCGEMRVWILLTAFQLFFISAFAQTGSELKAITDTERELSNIVPTSTVLSAPPLTQKVMACATAANDNFANATSLIVNGGTVAGTTCGSLESGETTSCNTGITASVWYKFVATATTQFVQINLVSGSCYFGSAVYDVSALPTTACTSNALSCQSSSAGPATQLYELTNLTVGATYYIQVMYPGGGVCGTSNTFNVQVTSANPGGTISNPPYTDQCSTAQPGCFFGSPPSVNSVTSTCTGYPLAAAGYSANSVFTLYQQFTSSASWSNFSWQAIITSNCLGGNVVWLNWTLYNCSCGIIGCGDINTLTGNGLACATCYIIKYQFELANCSSFTTVWPYQNVPSSPTPCNALPIELLYFTAKYQDDNTVRLDWETATEVNAKQFVVEKSSDGFNYSPIKMLDATGQNGGGGKYSVTDDSRTGDGTYYYKLRELDNDGKESFSKIIALSVDGQSGILCCSPNPAQNSFDVVLSSKLYDQDTRIEIYDLSGHKMMDEMFRPSGPLKVIDISSLSPGLYFVNITSPAASKVIRQKLVKQ